MSSYENDRVMRGEPGPMGPQGPPGVQGLQGIQGPRDTTYNGFRLDTAEFCGYAKAKLATIEEDVKDIKAALNSVRWKVAAIGGVVSLIVTIITLLVRKQIGL